MRANFGGTGLLTWSWRKSSDLDEVMTISVNGAPLGVFEYDHDGTLGFAHAASLLTSAETNAVLWHIQWGDNGYNPMALDDILFSPPAAAALREAIKVSAAARLSPRRELRGPPRRW